MIKFLKITNKKKIILYNSLKIVTKIIKVFKQFSKKIKIKVW